MSSSRSVKQIVKDSGGAEAIAKASEARGQKLSSWAVYKWTDNGIPEKHWELMKDLCGAEPMEIYSANSDLRAAA